MSDIDFLIDQSSEWLRSSGPGSDIVVSSRVRLARNLQDFTFSQKLKDPQRDSIIHILEDAVDKSSMLKGSKFIRFENLDELDRQLLVERHLISREHAGSDGRRAVVLTSNEVMSLMILEEDHLRLQVFQSGFNLYECWRIVSSVDNEIEKNVNYSFNSNLGYLTACPTNVGTGIRASCMLHLPSLVLTKQVHKVLQALSKLNLAARGLYGEGTQATGNFFQISNQMTLGQKEEEILGNLETVIRQVVDHEKEAREYLKAKKKVKFEDQIWRALGTLKSARTISSSEATQLLSLIQLGYYTGIFSGQIKNKELNSLFLLIQPAHLQKLTKQSLGVSERDSKRAELIRKHLEKMSI